MKPLARFDGVAAWAALTDEQRRIIGALALEFAVAAAVAVTTEDDAGAELQHRAAQAAGEKLFAMFDELVMEALPAGALADHPIPSALGSVCVLCGCSEHDACGAFGCAWADEARTVCTNCAPGVGPARPPYKIGSTIQ